ncbi:hypothetical protein U0D62_25465, partial [Aquimarina sp. 2201CG5-10]|nr:hypothetical protein [Aquimarina sp. 2201CG5-10]
YTFEARTTTDGCIYSEDFTINNIDFIAVTGSATSEPTCNGDTDGSLSFTITDIDLTATTYSYTITGGSITGSITGGPINTTPTPITGLGAGTYTITVTDNTTSCTATDTVVITEPAVLGFTAVVDEADCGANTGTITVTATGGRGGYEYRLVNSGGTEVVAYQSSNVFTNLGPDTYTVFVRDGNSAAACEFSDTVTVTQTLSPTIALATGGDACYDTTDQASQWITITGGVGPYTYSLNGGAPVAITFLASPPNPANTFEIPGLTPGSYSVTVSDSNNCPSGAVTFDIEPQLTITASLTKDLDCSASPDATIAFTITGGNGSNVIEIIRDSVVIDNNYTGGSPYTTSVAGTYEIRVTDAEGCQATSTPIDVNALVPLGGSTSVVDPDCAGDEGSITVTVTGGVGPYTYNLDAGTQVVTTGATTTTFNNVPVGAHVITITDSLGCVITPALNATITAPTPIT